MLVSSCAMLRERCSEITRETNRLYKRYIDDVLGASSSTRQDLGSFMKFCSAYHPSLKYTFEISESSLSFLDLCLSISDARITATIHYKPNDTHSYLDYSSSHPPHCKKAYHTVSFSVFEGSARTMMSMWLNPRKWHRSLRAEDIFVVLLPIAKGEPRRSAAKEHSAIPDEGTGPDASRKYL